MISSQNSGKILSTAWESMRLEALQNQDKFTTDELSFLDWGVQDGPNGHLDRFDSTMDIGTRPVESGSRSRPYDWRNNPEVGQ